MVFRILHNPLEDLIGHPPQIGLPVFRGAWINPEYLTDPLLDFSCDRVFFRQDPSEVEIQKDSFAEKRQIILEIDQLSLVDPLKIMVVSGNRFPCFIPHIRVRLRFFHLSLHYSE